MTDNEDWKARALLMKNWMDEFHGSSLWEGDTIWNNFCNRYYEQDPEAWFKETAND